MKKINVKLFLSLIPGVGAVLYLLFLNPVKDRAEDAFSQDKWRFDKLALIKFEDVSNLWNVVFDHKENAMGDSTLLGFVFPSVATHDFDKNGRIDIFYSGGRRNYLYLNMGDGNFLEAAREFGISGDEDHELVNSQGVLADFNGDGEDDLYLATAGRHRLFYREKNKKHFREVTEKLNGYASFSHGINVLDFNQDGLLDVVVANFIENGSEYRMTTWYIPRRYDQQNGGWNHLLIQDKNGNFNLSKDVDFLTRSYTHSAGVSDINADGYPDVLFSNDYNGHDQMFLNIDGKKVRDVTQEFIPKQWHGGTGMNTEFMDFNKDGLIDIYVTNAFKPPFNKQYNLLWKKRSEKGGFDPISWNMNVGKCGFSWAAKFADFNLDGDLDLFVANGHLKDNRLKKMEDGKSFWYERMQLTSLPYFLLVKMREFEKNPSRKYFSSAFERDCLFIQDGDNFYDIAGDIGLSDDQEGRGMSIADFNDDGLMDIVVTNFQGQSKVYLNQSTPTGSWVGFTLFDKNQSRLPIGAKIKLKQTKGPDLVREYYPANGFRAQSDYRLHFGLASGSHPISLEVIWPLTKKKIIYSNIFEKRYNDIRE